MPPGAPLLSVCWTTWFSISTSRISSWIWLCAISYRGFGSCIRYAAATIEQSTSSTPAASVAAAAAAAVVDADDGGGVGDGSVATTPFCTVGEGVVVRRLPLVGCFGKCCCCSSSKPLMPVRTFEGSSTADAATAAAAGCPATGSLICSNRDARSRTLR
uniref:Putative secreted peptide n=1 Tax=Anopheles braziliensis TaxID=58242 RepID=A0A2M3ZNY3_9DIPT